MRLIFKKRPIKPLQFSILLCLFLAALNFITRYYYFAFIAFALFCLVYRGKIRMPVAGFSLILLAVSWVIFAPGLTASVFNIFKPFVYFLCYIMGYNMVESDEHENAVDSKKFFLLVSVLAAGTFVHYLLNWVTNFDTYESRNTVDIWTKAIMAATGQASLACLPLALALAGIFSQNSRKIKLVSFGVLAVVVGYNLILSGRTLFVLIIVVSVMAFLHRLVRERNTKLRSIFSVALIVLAIFLIYRLDVLGIRTAIEESPFYERFFGERGMDLEEDGRMRKKLYHLKNMMNHPFGGAHARAQIGHSHDIFLDTYDEAGIFAFIGVVIFIIQAIGTAVRCILNRNISFGVRQTVLCLYLLVLTEFMVEPILQGMPWLFASFCFIDGCVRRITQQPLTIGEAHENY